MQYEALETYDLSLTFDGTGRLWKFRPTRGTHGRQPVDARIDGAAIVVSVTVDGLESGDVDLHADGRVLKVRGKADRTISLACDVAFPRPIDLGQVETTYSHGVLDIRVPLVPAKTGVKTIESIAVTV